VTQFQSPARRVLEWLARRGLRVELKNAFLSAGLEGA
jgi:hypothetical protein